MSDDQITIERHGDGHAVYSGRVYGDYDPGDGSFFAGSHGNRLFNVTDATEAGLRVAHEMVAAVNALPELLERVKRYEEALAEVVGCFDAADAEGLPQRIWGDGNTHEVGSLCDLVVCRLFPAAESARAALNQEGKP